MRPIGGTKAAPPIQARYRPGAEPRRMPGRCPLQSRAPAPQSATGPAWGACSQRKAPSTFRSSRWHCTHSCTQISPPAAPKYPAPARRVAAREGQLAAAHLGRAGELFNFQRRSRNMNMSQCAKSSSSPVGWRRRLRVPGLQAKFVLGPSTTTQPRCA